MTGTDFVQLVHATLPSRLSESGKVLYSSDATLCAGDLYVLGYNPGGHTDLPSIAKDLESFVGRQSNAYCDEEWGDYARGNAPIQRRLQWLMKELSLDIHRTCASNLIFLRSKSAMGVNYPQDAALCWPVHRAILNVVKPKVILCLGMGHPSAYSFIRDHAFDVGSIATEESFFSGHKPWNCHATFGRIDARPTTVVGIPHLARYKIVDKKDVVARIAGYLRQPHA